MQGYPFGEFMFWRVEAENAGLMFSAPFKGSSYLALE